MDEFVIEKNIEISIDISTSIVYADPDLRSLSVTLQQDTIGMLIHF